MKPTIWNSIEATVVTGGESSCHWEASGVSLNINEIQPGDMFLAAPDDDIDTAYKKGASVVAVPRGVQVSGGYPVLRVGSPFTALQGLSSAARFRTHATVISVQGLQARQNMVDLLSHSGVVHDGGKHVSLGLANLPENADFGVFSASPAVKPDIVVITNPETANRDTLFESITSYGVVIVNADAPGFLDVVARARAAGVETVLTYGRHECADAAIDQALFADNGIRLKGTVMGEEYSLVVPTEYKENAMILAAFLVLRMSDMSLNRIVPDGTALAAGGNGVSLLDGALGDKNARQAVFRIRNMIDLGRGRQTAILDNLGEKTLCANRKGLQIPRRFASFDFVHTGRGIHMVDNARALIGKSRRKSRVEQVTPDVLMPGDFLVFREIWNSSRAIFSEALRLMPGNKQGAADAI